MINSTTSGGSGISVVGSSNINVNTINNVSTIALNNDIICNNISANIFTNTSGPRNTYTWNVAQITCEGWVPNSCMTSQDIYFFLKNFKIIRMRIMLLPLQTLQMVENI